MLKFLASRAVLYFPPVDEFCVVYAFPFYRGAQKLISTFRISSTDTMRDLHQEDPSENWLYPSVAPASLELETYSSSISTLRQRNISPFAVLTVFVFIFR